MCHVHEHNLEHLGESKKKIISLLIYSKQIAINKLKVERRTVKTYLQFILIKKETTFNHNIFLRLKKKTNVIKLQCYNFYLY